MSQSGHRLQNRDVPRKEIVREVALNRLLGSARRCVTSHGDIRSRPIQENRPIHELFEIAGKNKTSGFDNNNKELNTKRDINTKVSVKSKKHLNRSSPQKGASRPRLVNQQLHTSPSLNLVGDNEDFMALSIVGTSHVPIHKVTEERPQIHCPLKKNTEPVPVSPENPDEHFRISLHLPEISGADSPLFNNPSIQDFANLSMDSLMLPRYD